MSIHCHLIVLKHQRQQYYFPSNSCSCSLSSRGRGYTLALLERISNQRAPSLVTLVTEAAVLWSVHMAASSGDIVLHDVNRRYLYMLLFSRACYGAEHKRGHFETFPGLRRRYFVNGIYIFNFNLLTAFLTSVILLWVCRWMNVLLSGFAANNRPMYDTLRRVGVNAQLH